MIEAKESLVGKVSQTQEINGNINKEVVIIEPKLQEKEATPTEQTQIITPDTNFDGISKMTINPIPSEYVVPTGTLNITQNGEYNVKNYETASVATSGVDINEYFDDTITLATTYNCGWPQLVKKLENVKIASTVKNANSLFREFKGISITFASDNNWTTANDLQYLFWNCSNITSLDLSTFKPSGNINNISNAFSNCSNLEGTLDISHWDITITGNIFAMFFNCSKLTRIDMKNITITTNGWNGANMFSGCTSLEFLDCRSLSFENMNNNNSMFNGVPNNCEIIVGTSNDKTKVLTLFSNLTNVKTVEEYNAERE